MKINKDQILAMYDVVKNNEGEIETPAIAGPCIVMPAVTNSEELNYAVTELVSHYLNGYSKGMNYTNISEVIGVLERVKSELMSLEESKLNENIKITNIDDRKIFYIDVGDLPAEETVKYLEKIKKEMQEKK